MQILSPSHVYSRSTPCKTLTCTTTQIHSGPRYVHVKCVGYTGRRRRSTEGYIMKYWGLQYEVLRVTLWSTEGYTVNYKGQYGEVQRVTIFTHVDILYCQVYGDQAVYTSCSEKESVLQVTEQLLLHWALEKLFLISIG